MAWHRPEVVKADLGQARNWSFRLFDHVDDIVTLHHVDPETLVVLHLLGVDQPVAVGAELRDLPQVGDENGVVENHQHIVSGRDAGGGQSHGVRRAEPLLLDDVAAVEGGKLRLHERLDLTAAVLVGNEDEFVGLENLRRLTMC
jgi:hypothetical protein